MKYKLLGPHIEQVKGRNKDALNTNLMGVSIAKRFIPSIANIIGTDLSTYRIVHPGDFAFCPVTSRNGEKITIARYKGVSDCIISQAYTPFRVIDENELNPDYLMMWFRRPEFDRYARFHSHGSVREIFSWEEMCNVSLPIPDIDEQRKIVAEYQAIEERIDNNNRLIKKLEESAQTLYHHTFIENIKSENLPEGWYYGNVRSFCKKMTSGGTPSRIEPSYWSKKEYRWLKTGEVHNNVIIDTEEYISQEGLQNSSAKIIPRGSITVAMYCANGVTGGQVAYLDCETTTNQACCNMVCHSREDAACLFFYFLNRQEEIKRLANGAAQDNLSQALIAEQKIIICDDNKVKEPFLVFLDYIISLFRENHKLNEAKLLLIEKLS